jgi:uncharacterized membrane protein
MEYNKNAISESTITTWILVAILTVVLFQIVANLFPSLTSAGDTLNASGFPLGDLFASNGAIWYILAAGLIILVVRSFMQKSK